MQGWEHCVCVPAANVSWGPCQRAGWLCFVFVLSGGTLCRFRSYLNGLVVLPNFFNLSLNLAIRSS